MRKYYLEIIAGVLSFLLTIPFISCGSSEVTQRLSAEEQFELGKMAYDEEEYLEAINHFEVIKLQYPGSAVADDAQFYIANCRVMREEFLLASEEFQALKRNFPASPLVSQAQYSIGVCYYILAPKSTLDQEYTLRAIDEFQSFIDYYPTHDSVTSAEVKIQELNGRLAKKDFESAELYMKLEFYKAATIYFSNVIEKYHDSPYAERAYVGKIRALTERNRYKEAHQEVLKFFERYPTSPYSSVVKDLEITISKELNSLMENSRPSSSAHFQKP
jgi:outer membrane protein assembly factor BamD